MYNKHIYTLHIVSAVNLLIFESRKINIVIVIKVTRVYSVLHFGSINSKFHYTISNANYHEDFTPFQIKNIRKLCKQLFIIENSI